MTEAPLIILVEDEEHLAEGLLFNLEAEGYRTRHFADGADALTWLLETQEQIGAILLDVMLPGKDGFEIVAALRERELYFPVLMLTARSSPQDVLEGLAEEHEIAQLVIEFRHLAKLKSNYVDALPLLVDSDSRVHTTFNAAATATGRLSSVNPNLQNIPIRTELGREIRAAFVAARGFRLLSADYSQIELRLMAHFSEDRLLTDA